MLSYSIAIHQAAAPEEGEAMTGQPTSSAKRDGRQSSSPTSNSGCSRFYQELVEAGLDDEAWDDLDAIEAVFRKLNAADEAETARRDLCG